MLSRIDKLLSNYEMYNHSYDKQKYTDSIDSVYNEIIMVLINSPNYMFLNVVNSFLNSGGMKS